MTRLSKRMDDSIYRVRMEGGRGWKMHVIKHPSDSRQNLEQANLSQTRVKVAQERRQYQLLSGILTLIVSWHGNEIQKSLIFTGKYDSN